jgi:hypothetical protein
LVFATGRRFVHRVLSDVANVLSAEELVKPLVAQCPLVFEAADDTVQV